MGALDWQLGELFAESVTQLLAKSGIEAQQVQAIGSHGQTLRHHPHGPHPFTLQIGSPALIAQLSGITTVGDFRSRDIAAGGEGAPLVPAFHHAAFGKDGINRCMINIGGIANITLLPGERSSSVNGFDTGPGNLLMNGWIARHRGEQFDHNGEWAASGAINQPLLRQLPSDKYFLRPSPKSTGREYFNLDWLDQQLAAFSPASAADVQATLCELTARSISEAISHCAVDYPEVYICGGGAHNRTLMARLQTLLAPRLVASSEEIGLHPDWVEAIAFAWLARQTLAGQPGNLPEVTGARQPVVLGAIYPA